MSKRSSIKLIAIICIIAMLSTGCSSGTQEPKNTPSVTAVSQNTSTNNTTVKNNTTSSSETTSKANNDVVPTKKAVTVEEKVLYDENGIKITLKGLEEEGTLGGPELKFLIENDSDKDMIVQANDVSVNGYMVSTVMSADVNKGKKANDKLRIMDSDLEMSNISTIAEIELKFHFITAGDWADYYDSDPIIIKTSAAEGFEYPVDLPGSIMYQSDDINVYFLQMSSDASVFGPSIIIFVKNDSDKDIVVQAKDASVNGYMISTLSSTEVLKGKRAVDKIVFMSSDLEENGITQFDSYELSLHIYDKDTWKTIIDTAPITATFSR